MYVITWKDVERPFVMDVWQSSLVRKWSVNLQTSVVH